MRDTPLHAILISAPDSTVVAGELCGSSPLLGKHVLVIDPSCTVPKNASRTDEHVKAPRFEDAASFERPPSHLIAAQRAARHPATDQKTISHGGSCNLVHSRPKGPPGRKTRLFQAGLTAYGNYMLDRGKGPNSHLDKGSEKQKLAWGWRLIKRGLTRRDAYLKASAAFWADSTPDGKGGTHTVLWEAHRRPSFNQFVYWGRRLNGGLSVAKAMSGRAERALSKRARVARNLDELEPRGARHTHEQDLDQVVRCETAGKGASDA